MFLLLFIAQFPPNILLRWTMQGEQKQTRSFIVLNYKMLIRKHSGFLTAFEKTGDVWRNIWRTLLKTLAFFVFIVLCQNINDLYVCESFAVYVVRKWHQKYPVYQQAKAWDSRDRSKIICRCERFISAKQLKRKENTHHDEKKIK